MSALFGLTHICIRPVSVLLVTLVACSTAGTGAAWARVWEHRNGSKVNAEFVGMENNVVKLRYRKRIVNVPYTDLSVKDQKYIETLDKKVVVNRYVADRLMLRAWQAKNGRTISASLARVDPGYVVILKAGSREMKVRFELLALVDQEYIRGRLGEELAKTVLPPLDEDSRIWTTVEGKRFRAVLIKRTDTGLLTFSNGASEFKMALNDLRPVERRLAIPKAGAPVKPAPTKDDAVADTEVRDDGTTFPFGEVDTPPQKEQKFLSDPPEDDGGFEF